MKRFSLILLTLTAPVVAANPWADTVFNYSPGSLQTIGSDPENQSLFNDPSQALGAISPSANPLVASTAVVQLGQRGSITLGFDEPVLNNVPDSESTNPLGFDFTVFGNAIELGFLGFGQFYREPGFVEVAQKLPNGQPGEWFLILPTKLPSELVYGIDTGVGAIQLPSYADVSTVNGTGNPLLPPGSSGSAGGDGFLLERAVRQTSSGVPLELSQGTYDFVSLGSIEFVRITDALASDASGQVNGVSTGLITTDIDAVIDLPGTVPEPAALSMLAGLTWVLSRRRRTA